MTVYWVGSSFPSLSFKVAGLKKQVEELQGMRRQLEIRNHKLRDEINDNREEAKSLEKESDDIDCKMKRSRDYKAHTNGLALDVETGHEMKALKKVS